MTQLSSQVTLPEKAAVTINCTYLATRHPLFFGMFSIQEKVHSSSWKPRRPATREPTKVLKPLTMQKPLPSTWRKPQSKSQTQLCTTVLWVTQWGKLRGELTTNSEQRWGLDPCGSSRAYGCLSLSLWFIQKTYKWLKHKNKKWIFPTLNSSLVKLKTLWHQ